MLRGCRGEGGRPARLAGRDEWGARRRPCGVGGQGALVRRRLGALTRAHAQAGEREKHGAEGLGREGVQLAQARLHQLG